MPAVFFTDVAAGPVTGGPAGAGVPIAIYGRGFGPTRGRSRVTIGGIAVARYLSWGVRVPGIPGLERIVVQPGRNVRGGEVVVRVGSRRSRSAVRFSAVRGRIRAVAPTGSDAAPCTLARPCATIQHAVDQVLAPGDVLLVRGGEIADDEVWVRDGKGGTPGRPLSILAYPGEQPTFRLTTRPLIAEGSHLVVSGLTFPGGKSLGIGNETNARDIRVVGNTFRGAIGFDAVGSHGDDLLIAGNRCDVDTSSVGTQGHCFYVSAGRGIRLLRNRATGAPGYGIHVFDQQRSSDDRRRVIADVLIEGNYLASSTERSGLIVAMADEGSRGNVIDGVTIRRNIFTGNNFAGIAISGFVRNVRISRNTFAANGRQGVTIDDAATIDGVTITRNLFEQRANAVCRSNCSWYERAHVQAGAAATGVVVDGNYYVDGPILRGARDAHRAAGGIRFGPGLRVRGPRAARRYGAWS